MTASKNQIKALLVGKDWFPNIAGGLNRYFYGEVQSLPSVGVCGSAIVTAVKPGQTAPLALHPMAAEGASLPARWMGAKREVRAHLQGGVDVVHAHFSLYAWPWIKDLPSDCPLVFQFQGPYADEIAAEKKGWKGTVHAAQARMIERAVYKRVDCFITLSEAFKQIVHERYNVPLEKVVVNPGAVEPALYLTAPERQEARTRLGWPSDRPILFSVRRLARRMGLEGLIGAMKQVCKQVPDALLLIGGKGAIRTELEQLIEQNDLTNNVRLLGFIADEDLPVAYAAADMTIVPTISLEGFGLVTVESLLSGTPVLGTPIGGTPEILRGLSDSLVFASSRQEDIAGGILSALQRKDMLPDRQQCRDYALRFGWDQVAPRLRTILEETRHGR